MDEHTLTQMTVGVTNRGLPPGCYIRPDGIAAKKRKNQVASIEKRLAAIEKRLDALGDHRGQFKE